MGANRIIDIVAAAVPRHYVIMEVKKNLVSADRKINAKRFSARNFKRIAHVVMGEPSQAHKDLVKKKVLAEKQAKLDAEHKAKLAEKQKKKIQALREKELQERRRKADEAKKALLEKRKEEKEKKKAEEEEKEKKKAEESEQPKEAEEGKQEEKEETKKEEPQEQDDSKAEGQPESQPESKPETNDEEPKAESKEEEEPKAESKEEEEPKAEGKEEEEEEEDKGPEQAVLTEEDEKIWSTKPSVADLTDQVLEKHFSEFSIPDKDEGFDEVTFEWQKEKESKQYVQNWVLERKRTTRMEHLQPSGWFKTQAAEFSKKLQEWQTKQKSAQETSKKKPDDDEDWIRIF